jgi:hypothetical protein
MRMFHVNLIAGSIGIGIVHQPPLAKTATGGLFTKLIAKPRKNFNKNKNIKSNQNTFKAPANLFSLKKKSYKNVFL